jgi:hypothetical protein
MITRTLQKTLLHPKIVSSAYLPPRYVQTNYNKRIVHEEQYLQENPNVHNHRLISISPGGFYGFYMLGICNYIREHYNLSKYIYSGASAGAWNSLLFCYRGNINQLLDTIIDSTLQQSHSIYDLENLAKKRLLDYTKEEEYDLSKLYIGVTTIESYHPKTTIFTGFENLEDAIDGCIASSHIPFISGNMTHMYQNKMVFDGGFSQSPYLHIIPPSLHITPSLWRPKKTKLSIHDYTTLLSKNKFIFKDMIQHGYKDAYDHHGMLDSCIHRI